MYQVLIVATLAGVALAVTRPGAGLALSLIAGDTMLALGPLELPIAALVAVVAFAALPVDRSRHHTLVVALVVVTAYGAIQLLFAPPVDLATGGPRILLLTVIAVPQVFVASRLTGSALSDFAAGLAAGGVMLGLLTLTSVATPLGGRVAVLGGGPITLGRAALVGGIAATGVLLPSRFPVPAPVRVLVVVVCGITVLRTGSRGPLAAIAVTGAVVAVSLLWRERRRLAGQTGPRQLLAASAAVIGAWAVWQRVDNRRFMLLLADPQGEFQRSRGHLWETAWQGSADLIVGAGVGSFQRLSGTEFIYAHNIGLELVGEYGVVGAVVLGLLMWRVVGGVAAGRFGVFDLSALVVFVLALSSGSLFDSRWVFVLAVAADRAASELRMRSLAYAH